MTYLPPRAEDGTPLTYAEDHCALRWPLVLLGTTMPILFIVVLAVGTIIRAPGTPYAASLLAAIWIFTDARHLMLVWPTGVRIGTDGIRIGGIRYAERHLARNPRRKPPPPSLQCYHVFSCPWEAVRLLELITDRKKLRALKRCAV